MFVALWRFSRLSPSAMSLPRNTMGGRRTRRRPTVSRRAEAPVALAIIGAIEWSRHKRGLRIGAGVLLAMGCLVSAASIGMFYLPALGPHRCPICGHTQNGG